MGCEKDGSIINQITHINEITKILPILEGKLTPDQQNDYKENLNALKKMGLLFENRDFLQKQICSLTYGDDVIYMEGLKFLPFLLENAVKGVLKNEKSGPRDQITYLSIFFEEPLSESSIGNWCQGFIKAYNGAIAYFPTQKILFKNIISLYQKNPLFNCKFKKISSSQDTEALLKKYQALISIISDKIMNFKSLRTNVKKFIYMNDQGEIKKVLNDILLEIIDLESRNTIQEGNLENIYNRLKNVHTKIIELSEILFVNLERHIYNEKLSFQAFTQRFTEQTIKNVLLFSLLDEDENNNNIEKNLKNEIIENTKNHLKGIDLADIFSLFNDNKLLSIFDNYTNLSINQLKKIIPHHSAEYAYLKGEFNDDDALDFNSSTFNKSKINRIKNHAEKYKLLRGWLDGYGYQYKYDQFEWEQLKLLPNHYPSLDEYVSKFMIPYILKEMSSIRGRNTDYDTKCNAIFNEYSVIKLDICDIDRLILLLTDLRLHFIMITFEPFFNALYKYNVCKEKDIDTILVKKQPQYLGDLVSRQLLPMLKEKFLILYKAIPFSGGLEEDALLKKSLDTSFTHYYEKDYTAQKTQNDLIDQYIITPYEQYQTFCHDEEVKEKKRREDEYYFKIYSAWANAMHLLPPNFSSNNVDGLLKVLKRQIYDMFNSFIKTLDNNQSAHNTQKQKDAVGSLRSRLFKSPSLQELTVVYNEYLQIKSTYNQIFTKIIKDRVLYRRKIFLTASLLISGFLMVSYFFMHG
ncbi:MAG TPA: hypothetical protein VL201_05190, partial [Patescibacteria group bacterium]|nr:hypothetical protein [Patescibacteria group bacterium]